MIRSPIKQRYCRNCESRTSAITPHNEYWVLSGVLFWGFLLGLATRSLGIGFVTGLAAGAIGFVHYHFFTKHCVSCKGLHWRKSKK